MALPSLTQAGTCSYMHSVRIFVYLSLAAVYVTQREGDLCSFILSMASRFDMRSEMRVFLFKATHNHLRVRTLPPQVSFLTHIPRILRVFPASLLASQFIDYSYERMRCFPLAPTLDGYEQTGGCFNRGAAEFV